MAIYHCRLRTFSRSHGHSAVAAAAYHAGEILRDERTNQIHRYEKRSGVLSAFILAPNSAPKKFQDRACLWNAAEASERRKNSRVAREAILALPHELSEEQRTALTTDVASWLYRQVLKAQIPSVQKEMERRGPYSVPTETEIKLARSVGMKTLKGVNIDKPLPKNVTNRSAVQGLKTRSEGLRENIPPKYRAQSSKESDYLNETPKSEASSLKNHHAEKAQTKRPSPKMTGAFNQDLKQQGGKRGVEIGKDKKSENSQVERIDPDSDLE